MKRITLSITEPILDSGEELIGVRYDINETKDFDGRQIASITKKTNMFSYTFSHKFLTGEYIYAKVTLIIRTKHGVVYEDVAAIKSLNGHDTNDLYGSIAFGTIPVVKKIPGLSPSSRRYSVEIPKPKFYSGGSELMEVRVNVYDTFYRKLSMFKRAVKNLTRVDIDLSSHIYSDAVIIEVERIFKTNVYSPKSRVILLMNDSNIPDFIPSRRYLSPSTDNVVPLSFLQGRPDSLSFYITNPYDGEILHYNSNSDFKLYIPASSITGYKEVELIAVAKYTYGKTAHLRCRMKVHEYTSITEGQ